MNALFWKRNGSTILTCIGAVGVAATSYMAVKATPKAIRLLEEAKQEKGADLTKLETVKVAGPAYIPAIATGAATIACIFGANILNKRQQASLMSAYAVLDGMYKEYQNKVTDILGEEAHNTIQAEIAKDHYDPEEVQIDSDKELFFDYTSMRYFNATMEQVLSAVYQLRRQFNMTGYANMHEFYEYLGLEPGDYMEDVGWSWEAAGAWYGYEDIEVSYKKTTMADGLECWIISFEHDPSPDYCMY